MKRGARTKQQIARSFSIRVSVVLVFFVIGAFGLLGRAVYLQVLSVDFLTDEANSRHLRVAEIAAHRGAILDRNGEPLAISTPVDSIWAEPKKLAGAVDRIDELARALDMNVQDLVTRLAGGADKEFLFLKRHVNPDVAKQVMKLDLPGVNTQREYRRFYPAGEVTAHLLGFTNIDDRGQEGLELAFDGWLAGEPGAKRVLRDRYGRAVEDVESIRPPSHGKALKTSIDLRIQYNAYRSLKQAAQRYKAETGSIVVLDVKTGEVLAMVSQPGFNPNDRSQYVAPRYRNRAALDIFEPGSSIKPIIMASALESGEFRPSSVVNTAPGYVDIGAKRIEDTRNLGEISLTTVLARSSNVGMTKLAMSLSPDHMWKTLDRFGIGRLPGSLFPGEESGSLKSFHDWRDISQATMAYGYGMSVTALQLAQAYAAIGNDGQLQPVSLLAVDEPMDAMRVVDGSTAQAVRRMLEEVVRPNGTGKEAAVDGYRIAGKTGTAWKAEGGGYSTDKYMSIFAGLAPATDPRLAVVVVIDEPRGELYYGGDVAAPVFSDVMSEALRLLAVAPDASPALEATAVAQALDR